MSSKWYKNIINKVKLVGNKVHVLENNVLDERRNFKEIFERNLILEQEISEKTDELNQANKSLLTLKHIWSTMNSSEPLSEVLSTVVKGLSGELGYLQCMVFQIFEFETGHRLKIRAANENNFSKKLYEVLNSSIFSYDIPMSEEDNVIVQAVNNNKITNVKSFSQMFSSSTPEIEPEKLAEIDKMIGNRAICILPIIVQEKPFGCLVAISTRNEIVPTEQNFLSLFAGQIELAVTIANLFEQIKRQAITDALTGLFNRRHFDQCLVTEVERALRLNQPFSLVSLDLDHLKKINDHYGHATGDEAIKSIGEVLRSNARSVDIPSRFGGEEFAVILPGIDTDGALIAAERMRISIEEYDVKGLDTITASIGVATFLKHTENLGELLELADQAMYRAKKNGRNRVEIATREEEEDWKKVIIQTFTEMILNHKNPAAHKIVKELQLTEQQDVNLHEVMYLVLRQISKCYDDLFCANNIDEKLNVLEAVGKKANMPEDEIEKLKIASMLHDIGGILTSEEIILKPGPLTKDEKMKVLQNPILAAKEILKPIKATGYIISIIEHNHEHWDGTGYPGALSGALIPRGARILFIVNSFFGMISKRPYRKPLSFEKAIDILNNGGGTVWDARLVDIFVQIVRTKKETLTPTQS